MVWGGKGLTKGSIKKREILYISILVVITVGISSLVILESPRSLRTLEGHEYTIIAKQIALGKGFSNPIITPLSWTLHPEVPSPVIMVSPLFIIVLAAFFSLFGVWSMLPLLVTSFLVFLCTCLNYLLTKKVFGSPEAGFLCGLVTASLVPLYDFGISATPDLLLIVLMLSLLKVQSWEGDQPYLLGVLTAFTYLSRADAWIYLLAIWLIVLMKKSKSSPLYFVKVFGPFVLIVSPWLFRNFWFTGNVFTSYHAFELLFETRKKLGNTVPFEFNYFHSLSLLREAPGDIVTTTIHNFFKIYGEILPKLFKSIWFPLLIALVWCTSSQIRNKLEKNRGFHRYLLNTVFMIFGAIWITISFFRPEQRSFVPLVPFVGLFSAFFLYAFIRDKFWMGIILSVVVLSLNGLNLYWHDFSGKKKSSKKLMGGIILPSNTQRTILTDRWKTLSWYVPATVFAPSTDHRQMFRNFPQIQYVFLTQPTDASERKFEHLLVKKISKTPLFKKRYNILDKINADSLLYRRQFDEWR